MNVNIKRSGLGHKSSSLAAKEDRAMVQGAEFNALSRIEASGDGQEDGLVVIVNKGDSMEKLIMDGAVVVVDIYERTIVSGSIYALSMPWEGSVLRECLAGPKGITLRPYNKNYPETFVPWGEFMPEMVIGKVYCSILNMFR